MTVFDRTPLVLVHGFWHGSWCWSDVLAYLAAAGRIAAPVDMAGHGLAARRPDVVASPAANPPALASDGSLVADITLDQAADRLIAQIGLIGGGQPVTVVAHSMAGTVLNRVAQRVPRLIARAVYLAAFMPESGTAAAAYLPAPENAGELVCELFQGDPLVIGALRFDLASTDPAYRQQLRDAFFGDLERVIADAAIGLLTPDARVQIPLGETSLTADGWGAVPRTYVACSRDMAIRPALQERFIRSADAAFPNNPTSVEWLDSSHSPFLSMPRHLADILTGLD
ncbi:alpha/beta hydrolase [Mycobacterium sp. 1100029.7]|nr:alpha/beta hydrolase [Mycobacterium sp. 1100029.7]